MQTQRCTTDFRGWENQISLQYCFISTPVLFLLTTIPASSRVTLGEFLKFWSRCVIHSKWKNKNPTTIRQGIPFNTKSQVRKSNEESTEPPLTAVTSEKPIHRHRGLAEAETRIHWGNSGGCTYYRLCKYRHIRRQPLSELTQLPGAQNKPYSYRKVLEDQRDKATRSENCGQAFSKLSCLLTKKNPLKLIFTSAHKSFSTLWHREQNTHHMSTLNAAWLIWK